MTTAPRTDSELAYDLFISYAGEDRQFVDSLARELQDRGLHVWYDRFCLKLGDSIAGAIDDGLARSRYGLVVVSPASLGKAWPLREFRAILQQHEGHLLPVLHCITPEEVREHSPLLADRFAVSTVEGLERVVQRVLEAVHPELYGVRGLALEMLGKLAALGEYVISAQLGLGNDADDEPPGTMEDAHEIMGAIGEACEHIARAHSPDEVMRLLRRCQVRVFRAVGFRPHCVKCRRIVEMQNARQVTFEDGTPGMEGVCPACGDGVIVVGKAC
ncbi:MAG: TIR domain-containing protein [Armatimonadia bacterium]